MRRSPSPVLLWLAVAAFVVAGCSGSAKKVAALAGPCGPAFQEALDPRSTQHLFPGAAEPTYKSDPPTSGPHQLGPAPIGVVSMSIPRPKQVHMLEVGYVLLQYQVLPPDQVAQLNGLAGSLVTVAPAPGRLPFPVVATAWTWKQTCAGVDGAAIDQLRAFIAARRGKGFGGVR